MRGSWFRKNVKGRCRNSIFKNFFRGFDFYILFSMQFIKSKLGQFKKTIFPTNKIVNSPKELLELIIASQSDAPEIEIYKELAEISRTSERNAEITDFVVIKM